jgi:DinB superfamily
MRRIAVLSLMCLPLCAADAHMTAEERTKVINWLEESRKEFLAAIDGITEEQWKWKPAPERWSVGETAEHIVLAEAALFANAQKAVAAPPNPEWEEKTKGKTEFIERVMAPRLGKATAPEPIVPTGKLTQAQVRATFERQRLEIEKFASTTEVALKEHTAEHPFPIFGTLNAYQWLIYVPLHTMRHDKQIAEVKATPGYPKNDSNP